MRWRERNRTVPTAGGKSLSRPTSHPEFSWMSPMSGSVFQPQRRCPRSQMSLSAALEQGKLEIRPVLVKEMPHGMIHPQTLVSN